MTATINQIQDQAIAIAQSLKARTVPLIIPVRILTIADVEAISGYAQTAFIADGDYDVSEISFIHDTANTSADGCSIMVSKCEGTTAPNATTLHLITDTAFSGADNVYKGFNLKAAINTVQNATMTTSASSLRLVEGDRLVYGFNGTVQSVFACIKVSLTPVISTL